MDRPVEGKNNRVRSASQSSREGQTTPPEQHHGADVEATGGRPLDDQPRAEAFLPPSRPPSEPPRKALVAWDDAHCWHPFTQQARYRDSDPLLIVAGDGHYLVDMYGRRYLDAVSSRWCNLLGHSRPEIDEAIREQLSRIAHSTFHGHASVPAVTLAHRLAERAPDGLCRVFYTDDGSTAVRAALQMAGEFWQRSQDPDDRERTRFLRLAGAAHGSLGDRSLGMLEAGSPDEFLQLLERERSRLAAVILEPGVQLPAGVRTQPHGFAARVRERASAAGTFLIADETAIGFGRSAAMFACEKERITPDLLCLSNGLTGGYLPMGAVLATDRIHDRFVDGADVLFAHGYSFSGNQLAASAALATLDIFDRTGLLERLPGHAEYFSTVLERVAAAPGVAAIRQYGLVAGVQVEGSPGGEPGDARARRVCAAARQRGVFLIASDDVVMLVPPITITHSELDFLADTLVESCQTLFGASHE